MLGLQAQRFIGQQEFPQVDDLRFIELREVEFEDGLSQTILQLRNEKSLVSPTHLIQLGVV